MLTKGKCKHFRGIQYDECLANVNMKSLVGLSGAGWVKELPCFEDRNSSANCKSREEPTESEIQADEARFDAVIERLRLVGPVIQDIKMAHKNESWSGIVKCPACNGNLHVSIAGCNGHVHGCCETQDCLRWME